MLGGVEAVDGLGHDAGAGGLADPSGTAKQEGLGQGVVLDGVLQRRRNRLLTHHRVEGRWPVFSCGYNEIVHGLSMLERNYKDILFFGILVFVRFFSVSLLQIN